MVSPHFVAILLAAAPASDAGAQREQGKALFKQGRLDEAIVHFESAVALNPADAVAWYNLAYASRKAQKFPRAAEAYARYTQLSPDDPDGYFGLAESLRGAGKLKEAAAAYGVYVEKEKRPSEQKWVEQAKQRMAELSQAPAPPRTVVPAPPPVDVPEAIARGDKAFAAKDYRTALFAYQDVIMASPKNLDALVKAGQSYVKMGHDEEAIAMWTKALQLDPKNAAARDGLAAARERGAAQLAAAPPSVLPPSPPAPRAAPAVQDDAAARAAYTRAVELIRDRKYDEAAAELDNALVQKPGFAVALVARGSARVGQGRYADAIADYTAAQKADPSLAAPLFGLAEAYRALGEKEKAAQLYRQFAASTAPDAQQSLKDYALQNAQALSAQ